jgi:hypothetical protein
MYIRLTRLIGAGFLAALVFVAATLPAEADGRKPLATDTDHVAIQGYDTVAYFTDGKAIKGGSAFESVWDDAKWRFASAAHRDLFIANPDRYMPQFGGFCAGAMETGTLVPANPEAWAIVDGKLYMTAGPPEDMPSWTAQAATGIPKANDKWPDAQKRWAAQSQ